MEIILVLGVVVVIFGLFGISVFLAFFLTNLLERATYKIGIPGWKTKLNILPPFDTSVESLANALYFFLERAAKIKKYDKDKLRDMLNKLRVEFIIPDNKEGKRYVVDRFGRKIAGDNKNDIIRIVVLSEDKISNTAFFHELGHQAQLLDGKIDYDHDDSAIWNNVVSWCRANFKE